MSQIVDPMNAAALAARQAAVRTLRGPVVWVALVYALLAALLLPAVADLALAAAPRAVADFGLLAARVSALGIAIVAGQRAGRADRTAAALGQVGGAVGGGLAGLGVLLLTWLALAAFVGIHAPPGLPAWALGAALQVAVVTCLAAAIGAFVRGPLGLAASAAVVVLAHLQLPVLRLLLPDLDRLNHHVALLGGATPAGATLLADVVHAGLWVGISCAAVALAAKLRDQR